MNNIVKIIDGQPSAQTDKKEKENKSPELSFAQYLKKNPNIASDGNLLYIWDGSFWEPQDPAKTEIDAWKWLAANMPDKAMPRVAASCAQAAILECNKLPSVKHDTTTIPTQGSYVTLEKDGVCVTNPQKNMGIKYKLACCYDSFATSCEFDKFLVEILPDEDIRGYVQEYVGYTLLPDCRYQKAIFWLGGGANGKSTLADIVSAIHRKTVAMELDHLDGFALAGLIGASLIYVDETPSRINEQKIKALVTGGLIQIDRKYREPLSVRPTAKWIISGNRLPAISDQSHGFWRRFPIVPFNVQFSEDDQDPLLASRIIANELSGVLNWALDGLIRLEKRGRFPVTPAKMLDAHNEGKRESNSSLAWIEDVEPEIQSRATAKKNLIYGHYREWCKEHGRLPTGDAQFWKSLARELGDELTFTRGSIVDGRPRLVNLGFATLGKDEANTTQPQAQTPSHRYGGWRRG